MNRAYSSWLAKVLAFASKHFLGTPTTLFSTCFPGSNSCAEILIILEILAKEGLNPEKRYGFLPPRGHPKISSNYSIVGVNWKSPKVKHLKGWS